MRWPLARQLPLLTALVVVIVVALTLTLTYQALVQSKTEATHSRLIGLMVPLVQSGETGTRSRVVALEHLTRDSSIQRTLATFDAARGEIKDKAVLRLLESVRVPTDTGLPIELWTADRHRVAHVGGDVGDSASSPEMRPLSGRAVTKIPPDPPGLDSVRIGALYSTGGRVYFWTVAPVFRGGKRIGYLAQQRRITNTPQTQQMINALFGGQLSLYVRNATDDFWTTIDGHAAPPDTRRDSTESGFVAYRPGASGLIGTERRVRGTPFLFVLEVPRSMIVAEPRATLRRILLVTLLLVMAAAVIAWALARRVTRPLRALTTAAEAIAQGDFSRRVEVAAEEADEVERLAASFNRMAGEVEASQRELASEVESALAVSAELEAANERLQETSAEAEEARDTALRANQAKSDFLAVMSHELRTPLNAIGGYTEILQMGIYGELNAAQQDALLRVARSQQTLLALINDVLNFAKLEAGEVSYSITNVHVAPALAVLEELVAPQLRDRRMQYTVQPCDPSVGVRADAEKLQQILINLLSNAIKYSPEGGRIDVSCEPINGKVRIHVRDTGIGMAADRLDKIFDPFIQVGRALNRPHEGVGLGLSISRDLAAAMGGSLSVTSVLGKGSTFTVTLNRAMT